MPNASAPVLDWTATCKAICLGSTLDRRTDPAVGTTYRLLQERNRLMAENELHEDEDEPKMDAHLRRVERGSGSDGGCGGSCIASSRVDEFATPVCRCPP